MPPLVVGALILFLIVIGAVLFVSRWHAPRDRPKFVAEQVITVLATMLAVFAAAALAFYDRENDEKRTAAAALKPYGTYAVLAQYDYINNWIGELKKKKHINTGSSFIPVFRNYLQTGLRSFNVFDKISENSYVNMYISYEKYKALQPLLINSRDLVEWEAQQSNFCFQIRAMESYLKILRNSWEWLYNEAEELHPDSDTKKNFQDAYKDYVKQVKGVKADAKFHDEDPPMACESLPDPGKAR